MAGAFGWRAAFGLATAAAAAAFLLVAFGLPPVEPMPPRHKSHPFDFVSVLRNRAAMGYVFGYASHTWELFGARSWMVAFLAWVLASQPGASGPSPTSIATIGSLLAMVSSVVGADIAVRFGRRRLCVFAMLGSGALAMAIGFCSGLPYGLVAVLMLLYNVLIQADSAALTTGAVLAADPDRRGATLSVHSVLGFSAGFVGPLAFGIVLDAAGGANTGPAWGLAFASLGVVAALGPLALRIR
jgi:predicted MFS family arabinose efflux permease